MTLNDDEPKSTLAATVSWMALVVGYVCLASAALFVIYNRRSYLAIFQDFDLELPRMTVLMFSIPDFLIGAAAAIGALSMLGVHLLAPSKATATLYHLVIIAIALVGLAVYRITVAVPMADLVEHLSG